MSPRRWVKALVCAVVMQGSYNVALASPEVGWWWNAAESGRGFFIESRGGII